MDRQEERNRIGNEEASECRFESAREALAGMRLGWNLGNSFDCHGKAFAHMRTETAWGNPIPTRDLFRFIAKAGFGAVRVPVTWYTYMDAEGNIDGEWLRRVGRVVKMVLTEGMYCIVDSQHDAGSMRNYGGGWIKADRKNFDENHARAEVMWKQIAAYFANESDKLILEGFNETLNDACDLDLPSKDELAVLNRWNQLFVDAVRSTGGNNVRRNLIVNTYAAGSGEYLLEVFRMPKDVSEDHLIAGLHTYAPNGFTSRAATWARQTDVFDAAGEEEVRRVFDTIDRELIAKGIPVVIGEFGSMDRANAEERAKHAAAVVGIAHSKGIPCFYWDDGKRYDILRRMPAGYRYPQIVDAMLRAADLPGIL